MLALFFYFFSFLLLSAAASVILTRNPVNSVLLLIFTFFTSALLFLLMEAELIAILVLIVYVGAVAVLFLFVVMMLDIDYSRLREGFVKYCLFGMACALVFFGGMAFIIKSSTSSHIVTSHVVAVPSNNLDNVAMIGRLLYTKYAYALQLAAVLLLVAIVGALVLTLRTRVGVRRQNIHEQVRRSSTVESVKPVIGAGVEWKG